MASPDKRTDEWLLVYSPVPVALIFLAYLFVVWAGPRLMKHREPFDLKGVLVLYNFAMVGLSAYMFYEVRLPLFVSVEEEEEAGRWHFVWPK